MSFISDHIEVFQLLASLTTTAVWLVYLNIFLRGFRQQRRSSLLINRGGGEDLDSRCLISNMGAQPAYLLDVVASLEAEDGPVVASVIDRKELQRDQMTNPADLTGQGPMASGDYVDIGSFREVYDRASGSQSESLQCPKHLKLIAIAATNQADNIVAAVREFKIEAEEDSQTVVPGTVEAKQIRSRRGRRLITEVLGALQSRERDADSLGAKTAAL